MFTLADLLKFIATDENLETTFPKASAFKFSQAVLDSKTRVAKSLFISTSVSAQDENTQIGYAFKNGSIAALVTNDHFTNFPMLSLEPEAGKESISIPSKPFCIKVDDPIDVLQSLAAWYRNKLGCRVTMIAGRTGKSTTKNLSSNVIQQRYTMVRNHRSYDDTLSIPISLLQAQTAKTHVVVDIHQSDPDLASRLFKLANPDLGVVTCLSPFVTGRSSASPEKQIQLIREDFMGSIQRDKVGFAILNYDDPILRGFKEHKTVESPYLFFYGLDPKADLWADDVESDGVKGIYFKVHYHGEELNLRAPVIGRSSVHSALRAIAVGLVMGLTWQDISAGFHLSHSELQVIMSRTETGAIIVDDSYDASPQSMLAALNLLSDMEGRKIAVLGYTPQSEIEDRKGYIMVGYRAADVCDLLIGIGERTQTIIQAAQKAGMVPGRTLLVKTVEEAVEALRQRLVEGDIVLTKGDPSQEMDRIGYYLEKTS